ncbi:H-NS family nucleoid-associated regulatory protein, partial [Escherichia coli]
KRQELLQLIQGEGFSAEELLGFSEEKPKKRKNKLPKAPPKYQFEDNGVVKYWSGRGRAPKPIDAALKSGQKLEDFLIKKDQSGTEQA